MIVTEMLASLRHDRAASRACWHDDALWHVLDANELAGTYAVDDYYATLDRFLAEHGEAYEFEVEDVREHGDLVVLFCRSAVPGRGETRGLMVYRLREGRIAEGWSLSRGAGSQFAW